MPTGTSRYWNGSQDKSLAGMPSSLAAFARKNLAVVDKSISTFNERAKLLGSPHTAASRSLTTEPSSAFKFNLNGNLGEQLSLGNQPLPQAESSFNQPAAPAQNWRFKSFVDDPTKAYPTNPAAHSATPIQYQPRNTDEERKLYGWEADEGED